MNQIAYVNGEYVPIEDAKVSVLDRGFLFADGIYEVSAVLGGRLIDNKVHLARLERSLAEIDMPMPMPVPAVVKIQRELIGRNGLDEGLVYIQVTRGAAERDFVFPKETPLTFVMFTQAKRFLAAPHAQTGIAVKSVADLRWARRDIKTVCLLAQVLAKEEARRAGCQEAFLVEDGYVTEGGSSTPFLVSSTGALVTRANSHALLPGCTRLAALRLAQERGIPIEERRFTIEEALAATEVFVTSATNFVMPVVSIDGKPVADGKPGPLTKRLREIYIDVARQTAE